MTRPALLLPALLLPALLLLLAAGPLRAQAPSDPFEARLRAGQTALRAGLPQTAAREYRAAVRLRPTDADAHYALAGVLEAAGRADEAETEYRRVIALRPDNAPAHNALAGLLEDRGRMQAALAQYRQAVALLPADPRLRFNLGGALAEAGRPAAAATQYREALRLKPDFAEAAQALRALPVPLSPAGTAPTPGPSLHPATEAWRLGAALARAGRLPEAIAADRAVLAHDPLDAAARLHLGIVLYADGQTGQARREWGRVLTRGDKGAAAQARRLLARYR
jgi:Flp pilus assembly protein TadD